MEEEKNLPEGQEQSKSSFQQTKENWYDKLPVNLKQMDIIVGVCWALIGVTVVLITLEALDIFHLFG